MDLAAILFLLALLLGVSLYLVTPLLSNRSRHAAEESSEVSALLAERERLLNALQELDFDFQLGKIPEEDYPEQRADLLRKGSDVLKRLDILAPSRPVPQTAEQTIRQCRGRPGRVVERRRNRIHAGCKAQGAQNQGCRVLPSLWKTSSDHGSVLPQLWQSTTIGN